MTQVMLLDDNLYQEHCLLRLKAIVLHLEKRSIVTNFTAWSGSLAVMHAYVAGWTNQDLPAVLHIAPTAAAEDL